MSLRPDGGYWMNGEFQYDENKPWLTGSASFQVSDYEGEAPVELTGRIVYRAVESTGDGELSAFPGGTFTADGVEMNVTEWRQNSLTVELGAGADRLVSLAAIDSEGKVVGAGMDISSARDTDQVSVNLGGIPEVIAVTYAISARTFERPFTLVLNN